MAVDKLTKLEKTIREYQAFLGPVKGEHFVLICEFEMLKGALLDSVQRRFYEERRHFGLHLITIALLSQCVIRAHALLGGNGGLEDRPEKVNVSLRVLIHPFLEKNEQKYGKLLKRLRQNPPERPDVVLHLEGDPRRISRRLMKDVEESEEKFRERLMQIRSDWAFLESERKKLEDARDKVAAHKELRRDTLQFVNEKSVTETFESFDSTIRPRVDELHATLEAVIPRIGSAITQSAYVLARAQVQYHKDKQRAQRDARAFWEPGVD